MSSLHLKRSAFLDRSAKPDDPVALESFLGAPAIAAQIHRYHRFVSPAQLAASTPPGDQAYVMIDDDTGRHLGAGQAADARGTADAPGKCKEQTGMRAPFTVKSNSCLSLEMYGR